MPIHRPHLGSLVHRALTRPVRADVFSRFRYEHPPADDEVSIRWLGTAGLVIRARGQVLLVDPFVSRPRMRTSLVARLEPDVDALRRYVPEADAIVCTHSHHDHILDVPEIARLTGARVVGSESSCNLARGYGLPASQLIQVSAPDTVELGPFRVTVRPSLHGKAVAGRVPLIGAIPADVKPPLRMNEFRNDETFGVSIEVTGGGSSPGPTLYHLGSADFYPETIEGLRCDVLAPCLIGRDRRPGFTSELLAQLRPRVVIPLHFDDFFAPLDRPIREISSADLDGFRREVQGSGMPTRLVVLDLLGEFRFSLDDPALPARAWD